MPRTARTPKKAAKKPAAKRKPKTKPDWAPRWLQAFEEHMTVSRACEVAGVGRTTVYERRQRDEDFALAWADIEEASTEAMEREAFRRGVQGVDKPVFQKGECVGYVREFSDTLLIFMLKARRPEKYRESMKLEHGGTVKHEHSHDLSKLTDDELAALERITAKAVAES